MGQINTNLAFTICSFDNNGNLIETIAIVDDWDVAKLAFELLVVKKPEETIVWRHGAREVRSSC